jgi:FtsH-binding integral membrane protein
MRALLAALSASAAYPGAWATFAPHSFYTTFPGAGHHWTAALPGYNAHLVADVGAFYLAFALLFALAAMRGGREPALTVSLGFALFSALHLGWHVAHLEGLSTTDAVAQTASLAAVLVAALGAAALATRRRPSRAAW